MANGLVPYCKDRKVAHMDNRGEDGTHTGERGARGGPGTQPQAWSLLQTGSQTLLYINN